MKKNQGQKSRDTVPLKTFVFIFESPLKNYQNRLLVNFYENLFVDILRQSTSCNL